MKFKNFMKKLGIVSFNTIGFIHVKYSTYKKYPKSTKKIFIHMFNKIEVLYINEQAVA